jgi:hypothetical protein
MERRTQKRGLNVKEKGRKRKNKGKLKFKGLNIQERSKHKSKTVHEEYIHIDESKARKYEF